MKRKIFFPLLLAVSFSSYAGLADLKNKLDSLVPVEPAKTETTKTDKKVEAGKPTKSATIEMPAELFGKYAENDKACIEYIKSEKTSKFWMGTVIDKSGLQDGTESLCQPLAITGSSGKYVIKEKCSSEDGSAISTSKYELQGNNLIIATSNRKLVKCDASSKAEVKSDAKGGSGSTYLLGANSINISKIDAKSLTFKLVVNALKGKTTCEQGVVDCIEIEGIAISADGKNYMHKDNETECSLAILVDGGNVKIQAPGGSCGTGSGNRSVLAKIAGTYKK
jgi:hypothetical protein